MGREPKQARGLSEVRWARLGVPWRRLGPVPRRGKRHDGQPRLGHLPRRDDYRDRNLHRAFRDLLRLAETRTNLVPVLGDATKPETYGGRLGAVDVLYQDGAPRDQAAIFLKNVEWVRPGGTGYLMVKARSEDTAGAPRRIFEAAKQELVKAGMKVLDLRTLAPYQLDHAALVVQKP